MKKQALALIFANGINFLVSFVMSPFLARHLSYHDNGTYGQINLINGYLTIFFALGIPAIINILLIEYEKKEKVIVSAIFWIQLTGSLLCVSGLFLFSSTFSVLLNNPNLSLYLKLYLPSTAVLLFSNFFYYYFVFFNKSKELSYITVIINIIRITAVYYAVNVLHSFYYTIIFINVINIVQIFVYVFILRREILPIQFVKIDAIKKVLHLSIPYLLLSIIGYSILYVDGAIVSNQLGVKGFALYRNGAIEIPFISTLYSTITAVALPRIVELVKENNIYSLIELKKKISNVVAALVFPCVCFCIINGSTFMTLYLGSKYSESGIVFSIYNIVVLIRINSYSDILTIKSRPLKVIFPNIVAFVAGLLLDFLLINIDGLRGAAWAYVLSMLILVVMLVYNSSKELGIKMYQYFDFFTLFKITLISFGLSYLSYLLMKENVFYFVGVGMTYAIFSYFLIFRLKLIDRNLLPERIYRVLCKIKLL